MVITALVVEFQLGLVEIRVAVAAVGHGDDLHVVWVLNESYLGRDW